MKTRSQKIAHAAYQQVVGRESQKTKEENKKYGALVHKLPMMILQNGLAQTTGFLLSKQEAHFKDVLENLRVVYQQVDPDLKAELEKSHQPVNPESKCLDDNKALHQYIIESDLYPMMKLTREGLEIAGWLRRYVQGILKIDATGESENEPEEDKKPEVQS
ncbi:MAG: hypothetical protein CENE_01658 [Candidatus Celerinatantimonas neptuna]|nr:MAG: hypothetical protein CENE_01658 [Candidatus Celerinatantimonas neptuna]